MQYLNLDNYIAEINRLNPLLNSSYEFVPAKWALLNPEYYNQLGIQEGDRITRQLVIDAFSKYFDGNQSDPVVPFALAMIWGYGNNNRGVSFTNSFINQEQTKDQIKNGLHYLKEDLWSNSLNSFNKIKNLGISYSSKVMYFAGRSLKRENYKYPLIFDNRVANSIIGLSTPKELRDLVEISRKQKFNSYMEYCSLIHNTAEKYKVEADSIEYFLFKSEF